MLYYVQEQEHILKVCTTCTCTDQSNEGIIFLPPEGVGELGQVSEGHRVYGTKLEVGIPVDELQLVVEELDVAQNVASDHKTATGKYTCTFDRVRPHSNSLFAHCETVNAFLLNLDQLESFLVHFVAFLHWNSAKVEENMNMYMNVHDKKKWL